MTTKKNERVERLARAAYEAYKRKTYGANWINHCTPYDRLTREIQLSWIAVVNAIEVEMTIESALGIK